jgi:Gas vesicle synthesis protein GvpL/GvpF
MSAPSDTKGTAGSGQKTGVYVYGILPGDVELTADIDGVGNPPGKVRLVRSGELAALVSDVDLGRPLGTPDDLRAHEEILDSTATGSPVLPLRFGSVLTSEDAVAEELLEPHHEEFAETLDELEERAEYLVRGRYVESAVLNEILSENSEAAQLREQIRGKDPDATRELRMRIGELINNAIAAKREEDTRLLLSRTADHTVASLVREPTHELDAVHVAFLVETSEADELERVAGELGEEWEGRVELHVRGPMAAWDFVGARKESQG